MSSSFEEYPNLGSGAATQTLQRPGESNELFYEEDYRAIGIFAADPTEAKPGSEDKVMMLAARYAAGLPLWHGSDRYDHGPEKLPDDE